VRVCGLGTNANLRAHSLFAWRARRAAACGGAGDGLGSSRSPGRAGAFRGVLPILSALLVVPVQPLLAAEIKVFCPDALRVEMLEIARGFVRGNKHRVELVFGPPAALHKRVAAGEAGDVIVGTAAAVDALARLGRVAADSAVPVATARLAVAVRAGATLPDVSTPQALQRALQDAASVLLPGAARGQLGAGHVAGVLERLGLRDVLQAKAVTAPSAAEGLARVAAGEVAVAIALTTDIAAAAGVAVVGPLPGELALELAYAAGVVRLTREAAAARAFVGYLAGEAARARLRRSGFDTPLPIAAPPAIDTSQPGT